MQVLGLCVVQFVFWLVFGTFGMLVYGFLVFVLVSDMLWYV